MESGAKLERNPDFRLESAGGAHAFVHSTGFRVETDRLGKLVWDALPGPAAEVAARVRAKAAVPERALAVFIEVMRRAGLAGPAGATAREMGAGVASAAEDAAPLAAAGLVSVIVTTHNGTAHIDACFRSIAAQTYPNIEVIAVDNASADGTVERIREAYPGVRLFPLRRNIHYTGGVNHGASKAGGQYLFILNQDTELDSDCVARLVRRAAADGTIGAVVPMMRFFQLRGMVNGLGNEIWPHGWGSDNYIGHVDLGQFAGVDEVPSACFGAVFILRSAYDAVGPLDRGYGSFYEDVDWSFRCWFGGRRIVAAPDAIVYHKFGGSYPSRPKLKFVARNRQRLVLKLFQGKVRPGVFRRYLQEDAKCVLSLLKRREWGMAGAYAAAYASLLTCVPGILVRRREAMRRKLRGVRETDVFRRNLVFYSCLTPLGHPRIDASVVFGYYRRVPPGGAAGLSRPTPGAV
jgi:GT2 family glycosyltransferase